MTRTVVGLTGGIGAGKSTASRRFNELGAAVVDVDALGHVVLQPGGRAHDAVVDAFGTAERSALAAIVFADPDALARLTAISHPAINAELRTVLDGLRHHDVVVLDMAILVERNLGQGLYDVVVTVEAPVELRVARAVTRGMDEAQVRRRIASQATEEERRRVADHVLVNDGSPEELRAAVDAVWDSLSRAAPPAGG